MFTRDRIGPGSDRFQTRYPDKLVTISLSLRRGLLSVQHIRFDIWICKKTGTVQFLICTLSNSVRHCRPVGQCIKEGEGVFVAISVAFKLYIGGCSRTTAITRDSFNTAV